MHSGLTEPEEGEDGAAQRRAVRSWVVGAGAALAAAPMAYRLRRICSWGTLYAPEQSLQTRPSVRYESSIYILQSKARTLSVVMV
jgi:hypothetical protein